MNNYNIDKLLQENEQLKKENAELKAQKNSGHMSTLEIITDLALTVCVALLLTISAYTSAAHGEGFFTLIKNAFAWFF